MSWARGPSVSAHKRGEQARRGGAGRGEERGGSRAISRETGDQEDARRAGLLVQLRLKLWLLLPLQPPDDSPPSLRLVSR